ncbi:MAG TPA: DASS family sodium-coupled anion symporter [Aestuariivirgaceae bacterium]|nr:DASS family sodium-coupled anion symporter [Aestuariivirgaceae bacterium]
MAVAFSLARDSLQAHLPQARLLRFRRHGYQRFVLLRSQINFHYFWEKKWFFISLLVGYAILQAPTPAGLSEHGQIVLAMSAVATLLFITEPLPLPTVPLLIIVGQVVLLKANPDKVAQSLMSDSVLFIMGSLMLAVAIVKQRLDRRLAWFIVQMTGTNLYWISFGITLVCGLLAAFVGEHTVAAMMLPVGMTLITLTSGDPKKARNVAAILLFSISYGCSIAGIATPSGGARNIIIINYWHQFFYDVTDPATYRYLVDYITWIIYAFPMFLLRLPIVTLLLLWTFKPETTDLSRAVARLRAQVEMEGPIKPSDWLTFLLFGVTIVAWITLSGTLGLGVVAIGGALLFLVTGLVRWEDINTGVNWGVVLLYAAAVSLGLEMQESGAAQWVAQSMLGFLREVGAATGTSLYAAISLLTIGVSNTMTAGAAVAVLGPIVLKTAQVSGSDPLTIGFLTAISSAFGYLTAAAQPAFAIIYASGYLRPKDFWKIGWKMMLVSYVLLLILAEFYWPLIASPQGGTGP